MQIPCAIEELLLLFLLLFLLFVLLVFLFLFLLACSRSSKQPHDISVSSRSCRAFLLLLFFLRLLFAWRLLHNGTHHLSMAYFPASGTDVARCCQVRFGGLSPAASFAASRSASAPSSPAANPGKNRRIVQRLRQTAVCSQSLEIK